MRRGGRTVHGDGIARGDGRAGARLDDLHGGGDTGDGLHVRKDGGYDEKEERGERPAHPSVMHLAPRARFLCGGITTDDAQQAHAYTFLLQLVRCSPAMHALASRRRSDHVSAPDARVDPRISTTFRLFAPAPRRGSSALLFLLCRAVLRRIVCPHLLWRRVPPTSSSRRLSRDRHASAGSPWTESPRRARAESAPRARGAVRSFAPRAPRRRKTPKRLRAPPPPRPSSWTRPTVQAREFRRRARSDPSREGAQARLRTARRPSRRSIRRPSSQT